MPPGPIPTRKVPLQFELLGHLQAPGQAQAEALDQSCLGVVRFDHAAQSKVGTVDYWEHDVHALNSAELLENRSRTVAKPGPLLPALQRLPKAEGQEAHEDVRLDALGLLMPDRPDRQVALVDPKRGFRLVVPAPDRSVPPHLPMMVGFQSG